MNKKSLSAVFVCGVSIAAILLPLSASADVFAYKQLKQMFKQGNSWHLVFEERLENTGPDAVSAVQINADLSPLGDTVVNLSLSPDVIVELGTGTDKTTRKVSSNSAFNGTTITGLLGADISLEKDEILQATYSLDVELGNGPIALQSVATPGDDVSDNGNKNLNNPVDSDEPTFISLPQTVSSSITGCSADQIESTFNLVKNGDFSTVHGQRSTGREPLAITSSQSNLIAGSFYSDSPYAGDDAFAADNNNDDSFDFDFQNGISIQQANVGAGITLFGADFYQQPFPGDSARKVPASSNYLLYNGNLSGAEVDVWKQQVTGLKSGSDYHFVVYTSNVAWPGLTLLVEPIIQLQGGSAVTIPQETGQERDTWRPVSTLVSAPESGSLDLVIKDLIAGRIFGDQLGLAQIGLFQCLEIGQDDDNDGLPNQQEVDLGTNPNSIDTDGDGKPDAVEVGSVANPTDTDQDGIIDALESSKVDSDGDGDFDETDGANDGPTGDADGDGISNGDELAVGSDPENPDSDGDGKPDSEEFLGLPDTDGDGKPNIIESILLDEDGDGLTDEIDNFDNRPQVSSGGGGTFGLPLGLFLMVFAITRQKLRRA